MPLPKSHAPIQSARVFLSNHRFAVLCGIHRHTVLRSLARGEIAPAGWMDAGGELKPIWSPAQTVIMTQLLAARGLLPLSPTTTSPIT